MNIVGIYLAPGIFYQNTDLKTQASFVFLPRISRGNPADDLRKSFVISMGLPTFFLDS